MPGFWQEATESFQLWVEPPIRAGEIKAVAFTTTALNTHQANFEANLDILNSVAESNEDNNQMHACLIAVDGAPSSSISVPVYLRNVRTDIVETFLVEADETTIPDGWIFAGGIPPTTVTALPGGNEILSESTVVPADTTTNPIIKISATRESDGESQSILIKVLTTPEIGFSFNPYTDEFTVWGVDQLQQSDFETTSTIIYENEGKTIEAFTVINDRGQYVQATLEIHSGKQFHMYKILEINYNGVVTITPEDNMFLTTFLVKNGELRHFFQYVKYGPEKYSHNLYNVNTETMTFRANIDGEHSVTNFDGFEASGVRMWDGEVQPIRLDTTGDTAQPMCPKPRQ